MSNISLFTRIVYPTSSFEQQVENYCSFGNKEALIIRKIGTKKQLVIYEKHGSSPLWMTALKVVSYCTLIIPLFFLIAKIFYRFQHTFEVINSKELEEQVKITQAQIELLRKILPLIREGNDHPEVEWLAKNQTQIFRLVKFPHLLFKMSQNPHQFTLKRGNLIPGNLLIEEQFFQMIKAKKTCLEKHLDHLALPHAKLINLQIGEEAFALIAEEFLPVIRDQNIQQNLHKTHAKSLKKAMCQINIFIRAMGFVRDNPADFDYINMPVIAEKPDFQGERRLGLVDIEDLGDEGLIRA